MKILLCDRCGNELTTKVFTIDFNRFSGVTYHRVVCTDCFELLLKDAEYACVTKKRMGGV